MFSDIGNFDLLASVPVEKLKAFEELLCEESFAPGEVIFRQGQQTNDIYLVIEGEVELSIVFRDEVVKLDIIHEESILRQVDKMEKWIVVDTVRAGEMLGWSGLVKPHVATATATAKSPTRVFRLAAQPVRQILEKDPLVGYPVMHNLNQVINQRLRHRTSHLIELWGQYFGQENIGEA